MSLFRECFTTDTVDTTHQKRWYKQSKQKPLQGSLYSSTKNDLTKTNNNININNQIQTPNEINKLSYFYNDRYPDRYLPGEYRSVQVELERLKQENIQLKQVLKHQVEPLRLRYTQLVQEKDTKDNVIAGLEARLGFNNRVIQRRPGVNAWNKDNINHRIAQGLMFRH